MAHAQAKVTKALGKNGVDRLWADLSKAAEVLAEDLKQAADAIAWPYKPFSSLSPIDTRDVHQAFFKYLHGSRLQPIVEVFRKYGYDLHDDNAQHAQGLIVPQHLYDEESFGPLAAALSRVVGDP